MAFAALAAGVSGLQAFSDGVGVIADNITNVNTIGYKETRSRFTTLVTETNTLNSFSPGGVQARTQTLVSRQGLLQASASPTDLALDGSGFFIVADRADREGTIAYTRAGSFTTDADGNFTNASGQNLLGYRLDSSGAVIDPDTGLPQTNANNDPIPAAFQDPSFLEPINISNLNLIGEPTQNVQIRANLQSSLPQQPLAGAQVGGELTDGTLTPDFTTSFQIFDSRGGSNPVQLLATKIGPNEFAFDLVLGTGSTNGDRDILGPAHRDTANGGTANVDGLIGFGVISFNEDGSLDLANSNLNQIANGGGQVNLENQTNVGLPSGLGISFQATTAAGDTSASVSDANITFDFGTNSGLNGFTSNNSPTTLLSSSVDGALLGDVNGVSIRGNGDVVVIFDNGETFNAFRIPVATFPNPDGLERLQGNAYGASDISGAVTLQTAGEAGSGSISANSLEQSTVDLANEFAELIRVQRAFSASTRIISTSDEILEELTRL